MPDKYEAAQNKAFDTMLRRGWTMMRRLSENMSGDIEVSMRVLEIRVQGPIKTGEGFRAIVKGNDDYGRPFVAFHNAGTLPELLEGLSERTDNGTLKWRDDVPYGGQTGK